MNIRYSFVISTILNATLNTYFFQILLKNYIFPVSMSKPTTSNHFGSELNDDESGEDNQNPSAQSNNAAQRNRQDSYKSRESVLNMINTSINSEDFESYLKQGIKGTTKENGSSDEADPCGQFPFLLHPKRTKGKLHKNSQFWYILARKYIFFSSQKRVRLHLDQSVF